MTQPAFCKETSALIGIDLGTTNSLAAIVSKSGPKVLRDADGDALIPSIVAVPAHGKPLVGRAARDLLIEHPERTVYSAKRLIGRSTVDLRDEIARLAYPVHVGERGLPRIKIDQYDWSPEEISAEILREVKRVAESALGRTVPAAVITVPAYFDDAQRQATRNAAKLAGIDCLRIVNEPTAASLAYGIDGSKDGTVLVYDLGGGTFDVSILKIQDGVFKVLATAGDTHLGGDDFDALLVDRIIATIRRQSPNALGDQLSPSLRNAIRQSAEGMKKQLSEFDQAELTIALGEDQTATVVVTRAKFESEIAPLVERTIECVRSALADAHLSFDRIDDLVLVGGSTRVPLVRQRLEEIAGHSPHTGVDPDLAVALGAAIQADILAGHNRSTLLLDVIPLSLGLETMGDVVSKLILRNSTIPASHTEEFSTQVEGQTSVDLNIYQGEREKIEHCRKLGAFRLSGIPAMPAGLPRIAVTFLVDENGVLKVFAKETRSGAEASIQVVPSFGLTEQEVRRMMHESIDHAHEDMAVREAIELRNKARAMTIGTRKALELSDLPPDQTYSVKKGVRAVEKALESEDVPALTAAVDELSTLTANIADDVISSAVRKSLTESTKVP